MKCCVKGCKNLVRFQFPRDQDYTRKWLEAIRRPNYIPRRKNGLCLDHFESEFIVTESHYKGMYTLLPKILKKNTFEIYY